ncbi:MAG: hypothetical protein IPK67_19235 [Planctomycetes bacterium]|nr:hypothetical protein [Planctomycetota bacterium]
MDDSQQANSPDPIDRRAPSRARTFFVPRSLAEAFATNERINQFLLDALDKKVWRAAPPWKGAATSPRSPPTCTTCATCGSP